MPKLCSQYSRNFLKKKPEFLGGRDTPKNYVNEFVSALPHVVPDLVRWHVAILFDEFLIDQNIIESFFSNWRFEKPADHFNRSGEELYGALKKQYG